MLTHRALRFALSGFALLVVAVIIWVDLSTDLWQKYVVMSGLAGGLITFVLSALVIDRLISRSAHERWAPVTRLALGDFRRRLSADPSRHDVATVRRLDDAPGTADALESLIAAAAAERDVLAATLAQWSTFLASSADVVDLIDGAADVAERLDRISELAVALRPAFVDQGDGAAVATLVAARTEIVAEVAAYHRVGDALLEQVVRSAQR